MHILWNSYFCTLDLWLLRSTECRMAGDPVLERCILLHHMVSECRIDGIVFFFLVILWDARQPLRHTAALPEGEKFE